MKCSRRNRWTCRRRILSRAASPVRHTAIVSERTLNDKGKLRQDIAVDDVRRAVPFFGSTAGEGGWRVAIVDAVDELNAAGANALLKIVEEPPSRALLLLVCHTPGRTLATIRSRCRRLTLRPLAVDDIANAAAKALGKNPDVPEIRAAALAADGSVERALDVSVRLGARIAQAARPCSISCPNSTSAPCTRWAIFVRHRARDFAAFMDN
jgi:DNA polymerase-3 subunit delta'